MVLHVCAFKHICKRILRSVRETFLQDINQIQNGIRPGRSSMHIRRQGSSTKRTAQRYQSELGSRGLPGPAIPLTGRGDSGRYREKRVEDGPRGQP